MVNYWMCVTSDTNWNIVKTRKIWATPKGNRRRMENVEIGDFLLFYVKGQGFAGIFTAASKIFADQSPLFEAKKKNEVFPIRIRLKVYLLPEKTIPLMEARKKIGFLSKPGAGLQLSMRLVEKEEYEAIRALMF